VDVAHFTVPPFRHGTLGEVDHDCAVRSDLLPMERRLAEALLPQPEIPFAREQAVSEHRLHMAPEKRVLDEVALVRDEDILRSLPSSGRLPSRKCPLGPGGRGRAFAFINWPRKQNNRLWVVPLSQFRDSLPSRHGRAARSARLGVHSI